MLKRTAAREFYRWTPIMGAVWQYTALSTFSGMLSGFATVYLVWVVGCEYLQGLLTHGRNCSKHHGPYQPHTEGAAG